MKILLLNPPTENTIVEYPDEKGGAYLEAKDFGRFPPLGALYVLSYLEKKSVGHDLFFKDCVADKMSHTDLPRYISEINPDIIGITSFTISMVDVCKVARTVRKIVPHAHICLGGHHPIAFPIQAAKLEEFDSIVVGEGEVAFTELVKALEKKDDITLIPGVYTSESIKKWENTSYKDNRFLSSVLAPPAYVEDIDSLPIPNRSYIKHTDYHSVLGVTNKLTTILSSRGCPYKCTFCDVPHKQYRKRSIRNIVDEVEECLKLGYQEIHFYDDLFNISSQKVIDFCDEVERRGLKFIWDFRGRVNTVTRESLERAKIAGCRIISFGVETGSDEGLKMLNKGTTVRKIREVFRWCKELKIKTVADFMIGLPFEKTEEDVMKNIDFLIELDPDYAQISVLCLYPNTELYNRAIEKGLIRRGKWEEFSLKPTTDIKVDFWEEHLSHKKMVELQRKSYKKYYLRMHYIIRSIFNSSSFYEYTSKAKGLWRLLYRR